MSQEQQHDRALLVGVCLPQESTIEKQESLAELARLADTAEIEVAGRFVQNRENIDKTTYVGSGFLKMLMEEAEKNDANMLLFDHDLSPSQGRNLSQTSGLIVTDRSEIILDIFNQHAQTKEARLQVYLAQLEYQLPRLKKLWSHLDRERGTARTGGSGGTSRGMGEKQIEIDRRIIGLEIRKIKQKLERIEQQKATQRKSRNPYKRVSLVGYTNAGKSTLFNRLTEAHVLVEDKLFATLDTTTRAIQLEKGFPLFLSDTVGFIAHLPHHLVASFRATLQEVVEADLLLHVVDSASPRLAYYIENVQKVLAEIGADHIPQLFVLNKKDLWEDPLLFQPEEHENVAISAQTGENIDFLLTKIDEMLHAADTYTFCLPHTSQKEIAFLHEIGKIHEKKYEIDNVTIRATVNRQDMHQLTSFVVEAPSESDNE